MKLIVISDIFGRTSELIDLVDELSDLYSETAIIDPYEGFAYRFETEDEAYQQFQKECGLDKLLQKSSKEVKNSDSAVDILGFSVGGTCAWSLSGQSDFGHIQQCICFYGSRIREKMEVIPQVKTTTIFPHSEVAFNVEPVIEALSEKPKTEVIKTIYSHGFMNRRSCNFSEAAYQYFIHWLRRKAAQQENQSEEK
jgi:dienelactone hydrolase